jgi:ABC-type Fe3+ transport system substrate-binding protein
MTPTTIAAEVREVCTPAVGNLSGQQTTRRSRRQFCAEVVSSLFIVANGSSAAAATLGADVQAKAKSEGSVVWYTDLVVDQAVRPIAAGFTKAYGIPVRYIRSDSQETVLKITSEAHAGRPAADVFGITNGMRSLVEAAAVTTFEAPNAEVLARMHRSDEKYWVATNIYSMTPAINTDLVSPADRPKGYQDLLHPRWASKMVWKPNDTSGAPGFIGNILTSMGEDRGMDYLRRLSTQKIKVVDASARGLLDQVIAGSYPLVLQIFNHHAELSAKLGAPVDWLPFSPSAVILETAGMIRGCAHPNAALLLLNYLISSEGQSILQKANYLPAYRSIPALDPTLKPEGGRFAGNVLTPEIIAKGLLHWNDVFNHLFR